MTITAAQAATELLIRRKARSNLLDFIRYIRPDYIVSAFAETVCRQLDQFVDDVLAEKRPTLLLGAPPQHGKSEIVSRMFPAYLLGRFPDWRIAGVSYAKDLASDMNEDVQRVMGSQRYRMLFPASALTGKRTKRNGVADKQNGSEFNVPGHEGSYVGVGIEGPLTGKPVDIGIIDDPVKNSTQALSQVTKDAHEKWYDSTFCSRMSKASGQIIMATPWAVDDLQGRISARNRPNSLHLKFKAIGDDGKALVPELHPIEQLLEIKSSMSDYFWSAMYQQSPKALGGNVFLDIGVRYYLPKDLPPRFDKVIASIDATFKDTDGTDYVVIQVWGKHGSNSYRLYQERARMSFTKTVEAVERMHKRHPEARPILIEDKANGPAVIDTLKGKIPGILPVEPDGSKLARAHAVTAYWEAGNVWIPHKDIEPKVQEFVDEVTAFPTAPNDDQVDAMTQALRHLYPKHGIITINPALLRRA